MNLISWLCFHFIKAIEIAMGLAINGIIGLAISRTILIGKKLLLVSLDDLYNRQW